MLPDAPLMYWTQEDALHMLPNAALKYWTQENALRGSGDQLKD